MGPGNGLITQTSRCGEIHCAFSHRNSYMSMRICSRVFVKQGMDMGHNQRRGDLKDGGSGEATGPHSNDIRREDSLEGEREARERLE